MGNVTIITNELRKAFEKQNITFYELKSVSKEMFFEAIGNAKKINSHGAFVTQHSVEEYGEMKLFLTLDETAGIAITDEGNIVSVFNGGENRGVLKTLLPVAIRNGGVKLDNYSRQVFLGKCNSASLAPEGTISNDLIQKFKSYKIEYINKTTDMLNASTQRSIQRTQEYQAQTRLYILVTVILIIVSFLLISLALL